MILRLLAALLTVLHMHALRWWREYAVVFAIAAFVLGGVYAFFFSPPPGFPQGEIIRIESGETLPGIAELLAQEKIIRSAFAFELMIRAVGGGGSIDAGAYRFDTPLSAISVALRLLRGVYGIPEARATFPEGISAREMAEVLSTEVSPGFAAAFLVAAKPYEGFLFPDTYHFSGGDTPESLVAHMREVFSARTASLAPLIASSERSLSDIVTMASLLEREANTEADQRIVAGILWKRLDMGMALQVDAVFSYIFEKSGYAPTLEDLKYDSPFNTYRYRGLPPTPIGNPGLAALTAALTPTKTVYLYYLTGKDGKMHYARTFTEHQTNRAKYLK